jgi:hypothetical protein
MNVEAPPPAEARALHTTNSCTIVVSVFPRPRRVPPSRFVPPRRPIAAAGGSSRRLDSRRLVPVASPSERARDHHEATPRDNRGRQGEPTDIRQ